MDIIEDVHTHPGGGQPPVKAKDLVGIENAVYLGASDELQESADTEQTGEQVTYTKIKEIQVNRGGVIRVKYDDKKENADATVWTKLYVNGTAYSSEYECATSYTTRSNDVSVKIGDLIQVYAKTNSATTNYYIKNFRIYFDINNTPYDYIINID